MTDGGSTWADPSPSGLFAVAIGATAVWAFYTGRVGLADLHILIVWLVVAAIAQVVVGVIGLRRGDFVGGTLNFTFGAFFFGAPALTIAAYLYGGAPLTALGEGTGLALNGWVNMVAAVILASFVPIVARQSRLLMVALATFAVAVGLLALLTLQPIDAQQIGAWWGVGRVAGWMIGVAGLMMLYLGIALSLLNGLGRVVLPIPGPVGGSANE